MIGFLDDAISNAFCDLRRVEALKHKIEKDGSQRIASVGYGQGARHARLANPSSLGNHSACTPTVRMGKGLSSSIGVQGRVLQRTSTLAFLVMPVECTIHATANGVFISLNLRPWDRTKPTASDFMACRNLGQSAGLPAATSLPIATVLSFDLP
jgi:hypothetical protein